jgi:hypothetical protein
MHCECCVTTNDRRLLDIRVMSTGHDEGEGILRRACSVCALQKQAQQHSNCWERPKPKHSSHILCCSLAIPCQAHELCFIANTVDSSNPVPFCPALDRSGNTLTVLIGHWPRRRTRHLVKYQHWGLCRNPWPVSPWPRLRCPASTQMLVQAHCATSQSLGTAYAAVH